MISTYVWFLLFSNAKQKSKYEFWDNIEISVTKNNFEAICTKEEWKDYSLAEKCVSNVEHETSEPQNCYPQTT